MRFLLILSLVSFGAVMAVPQTGSQWRAGALRGMTVGKSKRADMLRAWGKPRWSGNSKQEDEDARQVTWTNYDKVGEFPGLTTVVSDTRSGTITRINFYPAKLSRQEAIAHFGSGYVVTRYAFDSCVSEEESEAIYESPTGPLMIVEYRARGIAIYLGLKDMVTRISYVSGPIGSAKSRCND
jgi:hypothetical protein